MTRVRIPLLVPSQPGEKWGTLVFAAPISMDDQRLGDDVFHAQARIERTEGILKDDLHVAAQLPHLAAAGGEQIVAFELNAAGSWLDQTKDQPSQRALARSGFANQAESLAGMDVEGDVVHGAHFAFRAAAEDRFAQQVDLGEIADFEQGHGLVLRNHLPNPIYDYSSAPLARRIGKQMSGEGFEEIAIRQQGRKLLAQILAQPGICLAHLVDQLGASIDHGDDVLQIVTRAIIIFSASVKSFQFGGQKIRGGDQSNFKSIYQKRFGIL